MTKSMLSTLRLKSGIVDDKQEAHLLDLDDRQCHTLDDGREEGTHVLVSDGHIGHNLFECFFFSSMRLILLVQLLHPQLFHLPSGEELCVPRHPACQGVD